MVSTRGQLSQGNGASAAEPRDYEDVDRLVLVSSDEECPPLIDRRRKSSVPVPVKVEEMAILVQPLRTASPLAGFKSPFPLKTDTVQSSPPDKTTIPPSKKRKTKSGSKGSRGASLPNRKSPRTKGSSSHASPKKISPPPVVPPKMAEVVPPKKGEVKSLAKKKLRSAPTTPSKNLKKVHVDTPTTAEHDETSLLEKSNLGSNVGSQTIHVGRPPLIPGTGGPNYRSRREPKNYFEELQYTRSVLEKSRSENERLETVIDGLRQRSVSTDELNWADDEYN